MYLVNKLIVRYFTFPFIMNHVASEVPGGSPKNHEDHVYYILAHIEQKECIWNNLTQEKKTSYTMRTQTRKERSIGSGCRFFHRFFLCSDPCMNQPGLIHQTILLRLSRRNRHVLQSHTCNS